MKVDQHLRETLHQRANRVDPSLGGWSAITRRIDRRQRRAHTMRVSLATGLSFAAVALAVAVITVSPDTAGQNVAATGGTGPDSGPTTTMVAFAGPPTVPLIESVPGPGAPGSNTDIAPGGPTTVPDPNRPTVASPAGYRLWPLWPETQAELDAVQDLVDQGHQPWRNSPDGVVSAYLAGLGLPKAEVGELRNGTEQASSVRYAAGGVGGWVSVNRIPYGSVYYVHGSRSDRIVQLHLTRRGDQLAVDVTAAAPGRVVVRTKRPGSDWNDSTTESVLAGRSVTLAVAGPASSDLIVHVRHEGDDGRVGISETLLPSTLGGMQYDALFDGSTVGIGRLGPVNLNESMDNVAWLAGIPMAYDSTEHCATWSPADRPEGVGFVAYAGSDRVDLLVVEAPGVRTDAGIGVGSTVADVRRAYPGIEERITDGRGRLVYTPTDPGLVGYEMVFGISDGEVRFIWSGSEGLSRSDEICA